MSTVHPTPLVASTRYRTHHAGELGAADVDRELRVAGFVHHKRELGSLVFVELRDATGIVQCVIERTHQAFESVRALTHESVVTITGKLVRRAVHARNLKLSTGEVELVIDGVELLSAAEPLPFAVHDAHDAPEELRLRHRALDLRRARVHANIVLRSKVVAWLRETLTARGFLEIQTPILTASSPEGARDYLVPSRLYPGNFYALPQAPQLFKQLLMVGGFERYFQIAPCFRDEDARADRSPGEFYQLDIELAFVEQDEILAAVEPVIAELFATFGRYPVADRVFPRITYRDALLRYGSDKPDLRNPLVFEALPGAPLVRALRLPSGAARSRRFFEALRERMQKSGAELTWLVPGKPTQGLMRAHEELGRTHVEQTDAVLWLHAALESRAAHELRTHLAVELSLLEAATYRFCWVVDFPMYERDAATGQITFSHNPFSMPQGGESVLAGDPLAVLAYQYDLVCNGVELSSGALRNHRPLLLLRAFEVAGVPAADVEARFGGLLRGLRCGAPPHGGIAPGLDRMLMLLTDEPNLREITPFPLTQSAQDLLLGAPARARPEQLAELGLSCTTQRD